MQFLTMLNKYIQRGWALDIWEKIGMQWWAAGGRLFQMVFILAILSYSKSGEWCVLRQIHRSNPLTLQCQRGTTTLWCLTPWLSNMTQVYLTCIVCAFQTCLLFPKRQGPIDGNNAQVLINRCSKFQNLVNFCILLLSPRSFHFLHSKPFFVPFTGSLLGSYKFHLIVFISLLLFFFALLKYSWLLPFSSSFLAVIGPRVKHYL